MRVVEGDGAVVAVEKWDRWWLVGWDGEWRMIPDCFAIGIYEIFRGIKIFTQMFAGLGMTYGE